MGGCGGRGKDLGRKGKIFDTDLQGLGEGVDPGGF